MLALTNSLLGLVVGPPLVGWLNDVLSQTHGALAIRYSLSLLLVVHFWSAVHLWLAGRSLRSDLRAEQSEGGVTAQPRL